MKFNFEGSAEELRLLLGGIMVPIEIEEEEDDDETQEGEELQPVPDPWGHVEPMILKFCSVPPSARAGLAQYIFEGGELSPYVQSFRALDGIHPAVRMSLPDELSEDIQASFRVPGMTVVTHKEVADCLIQLGSFYGLPADLRPLPILHEIEVG
jgi:hypothetical protein